MKDNMQLRASNLFQQNPNSLSSNFTRNDRQIHQVSKFFQHDQQTQPRNFMTDRKTSQPSYLFQPAQDSHSTNFNRGDRQLNPISSFCKQIAKDSKDTITLQELGQQ